MTTYYTFAPSPIDPLLLLGDERGLFGLHWENGSHGPGEVRHEWVRDEARFAAVIDQLDQYFGGARREFDLELDSRGTPFQQAVWRVLSGIPYGETVSYGEIARRVGNPKAVRAVGAAIGRNPISIIVPCHRVVGTDGSLTGFGGGLPRKRFLLDMETG